MKKGRMAIAGDEGNNCALDKLPLAAFSSLRGEPVYRSEELGLTRVLSGVCCSPWRLRVWVNHSIELGLRLNSTANGRSAAEPLGS